MTNDLDETVLLYRSAARERDELRQVIADIILGAVIHPWNPNYEVISRSILDTARMMIENQDVSDAAARARERHKAIKDPDHD